MTKYHQTIVIIIKHKSSYYKAPAVIDRINTSDSQTHPISPKVRCEQLPDPLSP